MRQRKPYAEIAVAFGISVAGVKYHVANMLGKLGLADREALIAWVPEARPALRPGRSRFVAATLLKWAAAVAAVASGVLVLAALRGDSQDNGEATSRSVIPTVLALGIGGAQPDASVFEIALSADGRYVAFATAATNIVAADTNAVSDVFVREIASGRNVRVSVTSGGVEANGASRAPSISADGRRVAFESVASNLVDGDRNGDPDDVETRILQSFRDAIGGVDAVGRERMFRDVGGCDVFVHDIGTGETILASQSTSGVRGDWGSREPSISADGRLVAFSSLATNLVPEDTNFSRGSSMPYAFGGSDIFVRDISKNTLERLSLSGIADEALGSSARPFLSGDGRTISFLSDALNLANGSHSVMKGYVRGGPGSTETRLMTVPLHGSEIPQQNMSVPPRLSNDGSLVAFAANDFWSRTSGLFLYDRNAGSAQQIWSGSLDSWPAQNIQPALSNNGRFLIFVEPVSTTTPLGGPAQILMERDNLTGVVIHLTWTAPGFEQVLTSSVANGGRIAVVAAPNPRPGVPIQTRVYVIEP
jgi:Tol biopolymer transport system component